MSDDKIPHADHLERFAVQYSGRDPHMSKVLALIAWDVRKMERMCVEMVEAAYEDCDVKEAKQQAFLGGVISGRVVQLFPPKTRQIPIGRGL